MLQRIVMHLFSIYWRRKETGVLNYKVCRMVQDTCRTPEGIARLRDDPEALFDQYGLTPTERNAFRKSPPLSMAMMAEVGLHPLLRLHVGLATSDKILGDMSMRRYPDLVGRPD